MRCSADRKEEETIWREATIILVERDPDPEPDPSSREAEEVVRSVRPRRNQGNAPATLGNLCLVRGRLWDAEKLRAGAPDSPRPAPRGAFPPYRSWARRSRRS
jgi:hypothetical protein